MPGLLTSGDVDVHVRVDRGSFESARKALSRLYEPFHEDAWSWDESAFFFARGSRPPVEIALTVGESRDDVHKRLCEGRSRSEYDAAKRKFFDECF